MDSKYVYKISQSANRDIDNMYDYFAYELENKLLAQRLMFSIMDALENLEYFPKMCSVYKGKYRKCVVSKRVIAIYSINEQSREIFVERVFHTSQNYII